MRMTEFHGGGGLPAPCLAYVNVTWCGHCRAARPVMQDVAQRLGTALPVVSVDGDEHAELVRRWSVKGYPTILFLGPDGRARAYGGARSSQAIGDWACQQSGRCGLNARR